MSFLQRPKCLNWPWMPHHRRTTRKCGTRRLLPRLGSKRSPSTTKLYSRRPTYVSVAMTIVELQPFDLVPNEIHVQMEWTRIHTRWYAPSRSRCLRKSSAMSGRARREPCYSRQLNASNMPRNVSVPWSKKSKLKSGRKSNLRSVPQCHTFDDLSLCTSIQTLVSFDTVNSYYGPSWIVKPDRSTVRRRISFVCEPLCRVQVKPNEVTMVKALQELLLPDWNNAFIVMTVVPKGVIIPKIREKKNWQVRHGHYRTEHRLPGVVMYDGPTTVKSLLRTEVS